MEFKLIDIHCHLDFKDFDNDRDEVVKRALGEGIGMISVGVNLESSRKAVEIAEKYNGVFAAVGLHPDDADEGFDADQYRELARHPKMVAIGECGLDYAVFVREQGERLQKPAFAEALSVGGVPIEIIKRKQKEIFTKQIELAIELDKPLMIHVRDAHQDALEVLQSFKQKAGEKLRGDIHFFTGTKQEAEEYMALGFSFSFTGVITFTNAYDEIIGFLPFEKIMVETDAPLVAPVPHRGKRNEPLYVSAVCQRVAEIKGLSFGEAVQIIAQNAQKLFLAQI